MGWGTLTFAAGMTTTTSVEEKYIYKREEVLIATLRTSTVTQQIASVM